MNARNWLLVCVAGLVACGDDDGDLGMGPADAGRQQRTITGFSLGGPCSQPVLFTGVYGAGDGLTGHGELTCILTNDGPAAAFIQHGEQIVRTPGTETNVRGDGPPEEWAACRATIADLASIPWHEDSDAGTPAVSGVLVPYCTQYSQGGGSRVETCNAPNARQITGWSLGRPCSTPSFIEDICAVGDDLTGLGQLYCFVNDQGGMIVAVLQHGEHTVGTAWRHSGSDTLASQLSGSEQAACDAAMAQLSEIPWNNDPDAGTPAVSGVLVPYCTPY